MDHSNLCRILEARVGIEPTHKGFADLSLTTWVPRRPDISNVTRSAPKIQLDGQLLDNVHPAFTIHTLCCGKEFESCRHGCPVRVHEHS